MNIMFLATKDGECYRIINLDNMFFCAPDRGEPDKGIPPDPNKTVVYSGNGGGIIIEESFETFKRLVEEYIHKTRTYYNQSELARQLLAQQDFLEKLQK